MAIICGKSVPLLHGKREMTMEEFKKWLIKNFDADKDGCISKEELREAMRAACPRRQWFSRLKVRRGLKAADANRHGFVDNKEIANLKGFAQKHLGVKIVD